MPLSFPSIVVPADAPSMPTAKDWTSIFKGFGGLLGYWSPDAPFVDTTGGNITLIRPAAGTATLSPIMASTPQLVTRPGETYPVIRSTGTQATSDLDGMVVNNHGLVGGDSWTLMTMWRGENPGTGETGNIFTVSGDGEVYSYVNYSTGPFRINAGGNNPTTATADMTKWTMAVTRFTPSNVSVSLNGAAPQSFNHSLSQTGQPLTIRMWMRGTARQNGLNGWMSSSALWLGALSDAQVAQIFTAVQSIYGPSFLGS